MLALVLRELPEGAAAREAAPAALSQLRRCGLIASADAPLLDTWCTRLVSLLRSRERGAQLAGAALLSETARQCGEAAFGRHREAWTAALLPLMQRSAAAAAAATPAAGSADSAAAADGGADGAAAAAEAAVRVAAADALVQMAASSAGWPSQRRELSGAVSRAASALVAMVSEPLTQHGALRALGALARSTPHSLRAHRERLVGAIAPVALGGSAPTAAAAAAVLGALPCCMAASSCDETWLLNVQRLAASLQEALRLALGSVTSRPALRYALPAGYDLPASASEPPAGAASHAAHASRRVSLLHSVRCLVLALHKSLSPIVPPPEGCAPPLPAAMLVELCLHGLAADGSLPLRTASESSLSHTSLLLALPELHLLLLQLLHSTLTVGRRALLPHAPSIVDAIRLVWIRTSATSGPAHFQSSPLRVAAYSLASALLATLGPCVAPPMADALVSALAADLDPPPLTHTAAEPPALSAVDAYDSAQRKRARLAPAAAPTPTQTHAPSPRLDLAVCRAGAGALRALCATASELMPLALLSSAHESLLNAIGAHPPPPLLPSLLAALHASVASGRASCASTIPRAVSALRAATVGGASAAARAAAHEALHGLDALLHPSGLPPYDSSRLLEARRLADKGLAGSQPLPTMTATAGGATTLADSLGAAPAAANGVAAAEPATTSANVLPQPAIPIAPMGNFASAAQGTLHAAEPEPAAALQPPAPPLAPPPPLSVPPPALSAPPASMATPHPPVPSAPSLAAPAAPAAKDGGGAYGGGTLGDTPAWLAESAVPSAPLGMPLAPAAPPRGAAAGAGALSLAEAGGGDGEGSDDSDVEIVDVGPDDADRDA